MVEWTPEQKREYERGIREDYAEFCEQHRIETKGKCYKWVPVPMIGLTGFSLNALANRGMIQVSEEGVRPSKPYK